MEWVKAGRRKGNIQRKVVASILVVGIIPGIVVAILTYLSGINALKNSIGANFQVIAKETADKIQIIMDREIQDAQSLALSPYIKAAILKANQSYKGENDIEIQRKLDKIQQQWNLAREGNTLVSKLLNNSLAAYLKEYQRHRMGECSLLITDRKGVIIAATDRPMDYYQGEKNWWRITFNQGKGRVFISGIDYHENEETYSIAIAVPILDEDNKTVLGTLKMVHNVKDIFKAITNIKIGETGHANLVTSDGTLVICPIFPPKSHKINEQLMRQISTHKKEGWGVAIDDAHGGENSIIGFAPVISTLRMRPDNFGGKAWYIFVRQLPDETYAPVYALLWEVSFLGLALIIVLPLLGFYSARRIARPITLLTKGVELIGRGHLDHRIGIKTNDEIEQLAETFNWMADNLEKSNKEREKYLQQLKESEEQYKTLFDHSEDSMLMVDLEGKIVAVNKREEEVIGYSRDALLGQKFSLSLFEEDRETFTDLFEKTLKGEKPPTAEVKIVSTGRGLLTMELNLTGIKRSDGISFVQVHLRDITEKKILEKEIALERKKLETIIESMGDGLDIVDKDFNIQFMNGKFLRLFGKEAIGKRCYEIYTGRERPCDECPITKGIEKIGVLEVNASHGRTFLITHSPFKNIDGTTSFLEIFKDITKRKELEQQLLRSERLAALGQFSSMLAHDIRNPIIGIKKRLESLQNTIEVSQPKAIKRVFADLISGSELLVGMVNDVLDVYQNSYGDIPLIISTFPLVEAIEGAIKLLQIEAEERRIRLNLHNVHNSISIQGDKRRLQRVFINLLDNAIKYSPLDSKVDITFKPIVEDGIDYLLFKIEDEGPGIPRSELSKIFEPFHRKDGKMEGKTGTGLGLYFCKVVVEAQGGKIWAESREKKGAAFYIKTPLGEGRNDY